MTTSVAAATNEVLAPATAQAEHPIGHVGHQPSVSEAIITMPRIMTVSEMAKYLRIGRNTAYELVKEEGFPALKFGRQIRIPTAALNQWVQEHSMSQQ